MFGGERISSNCQRDRAGRRGSVFRSGARWILIYFERENRRPSKSAAPASRAEAGVQLSYVSSLHGQLKRRLVTNSPAPTGTARTDINPMSKPSNWTWLTATQPIAPATTSITPSHLRSGYGLRNRSSRKASATTMTVWVISNNALFPEQLRQSGYHGISSS